VPKPTLAERLGKLPLPLRDVDPTMKEGARTEYVDRVIFRLKHTAKREPDLERVLDLLEAATSLAEADAKEAVVTDETFDKYFTAALTGCTSNPALFHASAMQKPEEKKSYGQIVIAYALDAALTALENRKQVINGGSSEQGSVHDDQRRDGGGPA